MTAISNRESVFALTKEDKAGTLKLATGADATAVLEGFSLEGSFAELESEELSGSIGAAKGEIGAEAPTASVNHYMRGSGEEGKEVDFSDLLEGALGAKVAPLAAGAKTLNASTNEILKTAAALERGHAVLIKDAVNGFSIRNVLSKAGMDATLAQLLAEAPAADVELGRPTLYKPGSNHPFFSLNLFRGNGGALEAIAAALVTEMSVEITAGEYINGGFSLAGREYFFNPVIVAANTTIDIDGNDFMLREGQYKDPHDFAAMVQSVIRGSNSETVTYDNENGLYTIAGTAAFALNLAGHDTAAALLGFDAVDTASSDEVASYTSETAINLKIMGALDYDNANPLVAKNAEVLFGSKDDITCFPISTLTATLTNTKTDSQDICSPSGIGDSRISERVVEIEMAALLQQYDADKFRRFREGDSGLFAGNFGTKEGGNWKAGNCFNMFSPTTKITALTIDDADGLAQLNMTLKCYSDSGAGEFYINTL